MQIKLQKFAKIQTYGVSALDSCAIWLYVLVLKNCTVNFKYTLTTGISEVQSRGG